MSPDFITFIAILLLSPLLFTLGRVLLRMKSVKASLEAFEQDSSQASFTHKWLLGWQIALQRKVTRWSINLLGDRFLSFYYRFAGVFFLAMLVLIWVLFLMRIL